MLQVSGDKHCCFFFNAVYITSIDKKKKKTDALAPPYQFYISFGLVFFCVWISVFCNLFFIHLLVKMQEPFLWSFFFWIKILFLNRNPSTHFLSFPEFVNSLFPVCPLFCFDNIVFPSYFLWELPFSFFFTTLPPSFRTVKLVLFSFKRWRLFQTSFLNRLSIQTRWYFLYFSV